LKMYWLDTIVENTESYLFFTTEDTKWFHRVAQRIGSVSLCVY
jgi:hypothetical protein